MSLPTPTVLLNRRIADFLNDQRHPGLSGEFSWSPAAVQRVLGAVSEVILDALAEGEEVQLGKLGKFYPRVLDERIVAKNYDDEGEKTNIPRRVRLGFDPTPSTDRAISERILSLIDEFDASPEDDEPTGE